MQLQGQYELVTQPLDRTAIQHAVVSEL